MNPTTITTVETVTLLLLIIAILVDIAIAFNPMLCMYYLYLHRNSQIRRWCDLDDIDEVGMVGKCDTSQEHIFGNIGIMTTRRMSALICLKTQKNKKN